MKETERNYVQMKIYKHNWFYNHSLIVICWKIVAWATVIPFLMFNAVKSCDFVNPFRFGIPYTTAFFWIIPEQCLCMFWLRYRILGVKDIELYYKDGCPLRVISANEIKIELKPMSLDKVTVIFKKWGTRMPYNEAMISKSKSRL